MMRRLQVARVVPDSVEGHVLFSFPSEARSFWAHTIVRDAWGRSLWCLL